MAGEGTARPTATPRRPSFPPLSKLLPAAGACALALIGWLALQRGLAFGSPSTIVDFDVFHLAGRLTLEGRLSEAYASATLDKLESRMSPDAARSMPFAYPPPLALAMAALSTLPIGAAYWLFEAVGLALLASALRRAAPHRFWPVLLATMPAIFINVIVGQIGMLTGGMAAMAAVLAVERRSATAGALAGLLAAVKPQSCAALPMLFLVRRAWLSLVAMAATGVALMAITSVVLGPSILPAFLGALSEASGFLAQGRIPLHRMTTIYAFLRSLGVSADIALGLHLAAALVILGTVARAARRIGDARAGAGLIMIGGCFLSPYLFDYDLPIVAVGLAMALPRTVRRWRPALALGLLMLAESAGLAETLALSSRVSLGGPLLLACLASVLLVSRREAETSPATTSGPPLSVPA